MEPTKPIKKMDIPEAPASITYSIVSRDGYPALFTVRDENVNGLLQKMRVVEDKLKELLYTPQIRQSYGVKKEKVYVEGKKCPKCNGRLEEKLSKAGKKFHKCENGKYDFATKQNTGCDYVDWLEPKNEDIPDFDPDKYYGQPH